jgi:hypothetical protein
MPSHADAATSAAPNSLAKFMAVALPLVFCMWQANSMSSNSRISAPVLKVSLRVVAVCIVSAALLAANMTRNDEPLNGKRLPNTQHNSRADSSLDGTFAYDQLNWAQMDAAFCPADLLTQLYGHTSGGDPHQLVQILRALYQRYPLEHCRVPQNDEQLAQILNECLAIMCANMQPRLQITAKSLSTSSTMESAAVSDDDEFSNRPTSSVGSDSGLPHSWVASGAADSDVATPHASISPIHEASTPDVASRASPSRVVLYAYRHNPYSFRGYQRVDVSANTSSIPITLRKAVDGSAELIDVPHDVMLKPQQVPIDLRKRGRGILATTPGAAEVGDLDVTPAAGKNLLKKSAKPAAAPARPANPLAAARKAMKKAYEQSGMSLQDPLYAVNIAVDPKTLGADATKNSAEDLDTSMTMTGLPNVDGHRVAEALLQLLKGRAVIKGDYSFAMTDKRTDRFNTGACHLNFDTLDDARRVQQALRDQLLFASFRNGTCVVTTARE